MDELEQEAQLIANDLEPFAEQVRHLTDRIMVLEQRAEDEHNQGMVERAGLLRMALDDILSRMYVD